MTTTMLPRVADEIERIGDLAAADGVELEADLDRRGFIWIGRINRTFGPAGEGRRVIERLSELADEEDVEIRLACLGWNERLVAFYADLDFVIDVAAEPCRDEDYVVMVREPR